MATKGKQGKVNVEFNAETKCSFCEGSKCCVYTTQEIAAPRSMDDFDHLLWQLAHKDMQIYKDEDGWFLLALNPCRFLKPEGGCGIYETRPQVCRDYSNDYCEYDAPPEEFFEHYFPDYESLLAYCRKRFKRWDKRFTQ
ncbi:MAG: YkgJ family cysteine cluster protein [Gammaproteobacteria bacterium]|nr:YkgJ family cysteine cluster protein [Gammaproteobacteria bacterium]MDH5654080.1 YkgJ family cysteine cluster protein [Gammaproteobacteria bacterium]